MLGRFRRRLARTAHRVRSSVGYWWLEQSEWWQDRRRPWRGTGALVRRAGTAIGDLWHDLVRGVGRRTRRLRRSLTRTGHALAAPWVAARLRLQGWSQRWRRGWRQRRARFTPPRPSWGGHGVAARLAAARSGSVRRLRGLGTGTGRLTRGALTRTPRRLGALGTATARRTRLSATAVAGAVTTAGARTGHRLRPLRSAVTGGLARCGAAATRAVRSLSVRRVAVAAAAALVVAGAVAAGARLADERGPDDRAGPDTDRAEQASSSQRRAGRSAGPGLTRPGIHLRVSPEDTGDVEVVERIIAPVPIRVLPLAAPPAAPGDDGPAARLVDLHVAADDVVVPVADPGEGGEQRQVILPGPTTTLELRYRVVDADERSATAPPGRATLSLRPAASGAFASSPTVVQVRGAVVHTLVCIDAPRERQLCGVDDRAGWHTEPVSAATSNVLALVDLPPA